MGGSNPAGLDPRPTVDCYRHELVADTFRNGAHGASAGGLGTNKDTNTMDERVGAAYTGPEPPPLHPSPGSFDHMDAHPNTSGSSSFQALHRAADWDRSEPVRTWRQNRYKQAREKWNVRSRRFLAVNSFCTTGFL
jgi:hypothetical protein